MGTKNKPCLRFQLIWQLLLSIILRCTWKFNF